MGTSTSSAGAGSGASFDPPWLDDAETGIDSSQQTNLYHQIQLPKMALMVQMTVTRRMTTLHRSM